MRTDHLNNCIGNENIITNKRNGILCSTLVSQTVFRKSTLRPDLIAITLNNPKVSLDAQAVSKHIATNSARHAAKLKNSPKCYEAYGRPGAKKLCDKTSDNSSIYAIKGNTPKNRGFTSSILPSENMDVPVHSTTSTESMVRCILVFFLQDF